MNGWYICGILFFCFFLFCNCLLWLVRKKNRYQKEPNRKENPSICILIPARNESAVIEDLLTSIENQTYGIPPSHVHVIVESSVDPTVQIVQNHQMNYFVRQNLHLKTKGYALAEILEDFEKKKQYYDLYFIFDADNILDQTYISEMLKDYKQGYALSTGYRSLKNKNHFLAISAWLTFLLMNEKRNQKAMQYEGNLLFSGTGFYIHGDLVKQWKTFPFHSLTEDYECSLYCAYHGLATHYNRQAIFYDEQPTDYRTSIIQRSRWIKGYMQNWIGHRKYLLKKAWQKNCYNSGSLIQLGIGVLPIIFFLIGFLFSLIGVLVEHSFKENCLILLLVLTTIYLVLFLFTYQNLKDVKKKLELSNRLFWQTCFYHPFFFLSYLHAFVIFLFKKNLGWSTIEHKKEGQ